MTTLVKNKTAHVLVQEIGRAKKNIVGNYLLIGGLLCEARDSKVWKNYNDVYKVFDDFIKDIGLSRSTAYNCMMIFERFGKFLKSKHLDVDYTRLVRLLPVAKDNVEEWLYKAKELPSDGFEDELREAKGLKTKDTCEHKNQEVWIKCGDCRNFIKKG